MRDAGRQKIIVAVLAVVLLAIVAKLTLFSGGDGDDAATTTAPTSQTITVPTGATTTTSDIPPTPNTFDRFDGKNPFEPAVQITSATTTPTTSPPTTSGTGPTTTTLPGQTTTTTTAPTNNPDSQLFTLNSITRQSNGTYVATVTIGSTTYPDVLESATFGPSNTYRFLQGTSDNCGDFQHGDVTFPICENQTTNK
jgi:hypothetical protein